MNAARVRDFFVNAREALVARLAADHWEGRLSSSALSTATAVVALSIVAERGDAHSYTTLINRGVQWLAAHQNSDGGWGDTTSSPSNLSTTVLGWAACKRIATEWAAGEAARKWIVRTVGTDDPARIADAIIARYGNDRTFSAPILLVCVLSGAFGPGGWRFVPQLPFELAACPRDWFRRLRLPVVSYALPALIAIGYARHHHLPSWNPAARVARTTVARRTLRVLGEIQPRSGGFLEAVPLTAFVVMSLAGSGLDREAVVERGAGFLAASMRPDGSWPIDANLAAWVTTLAINGLGGDVEAALEAADRTAIRQWLLQQQHRIVHPYTGAEPGGWAWTDLPGGVPDADDTAGALIALRRLAPLDEEARASAAAGVRWLLRLQNSDGGIPTFCRGWTNLPFDKSGADLTAHALRAWAAWSDLPGIGADVRAAAGRACRYLARMQRPDGAWVPLWFGNQYAVDEENPTYGTSRVLIALRDAGSILEISAMRSVIDRATEWLLAVQNTDGGWGGAAAAPSSIEETALAISGLAGVPHDVRVTEAVDRGVRWLVAATDGCRRFPEAPIGLYFAKLWYSEELYPIVFTVAALRAALQRSA